MPAVVLSTNSRSGWDKLVCLINASTTTILPLLLLHHHLLLLLLLLLLSPRASFTQPASAPLNYSPT